MEFKILSSIEKRLSYRNLVILIIFATLFSVLTYGRWEYMTFRYGNIFISELDAGDNCLFGESSPEIDYLKVMQYNDNKAQILVKDKQGFKFLVNFDKKDDNWTFLNADICQYEVLYSPTGSANQIYWY